MKKPGEQEALDEMKLRRAQLYESCMWACRDYLRMDEQGLNNSGYGAILKANGIERAREQALVGHVKYVLKEAEKLEKEFLKKFPD
jgi:hypothetical protein